MKKKLIDKLNVEYNNYEKCVDVCAAEHITAEVLLNMKNVLKSLLEEVDGELNSIFDGE